MSADIPRSVMEEATALVDKVMTSGGYAANTRLVAEALLSRDKRSAEIARNNDPFPEEGKYIASLITTYPEGKEDGL